MGIFFEFRANPQREAETRRKKLTVLLLGCLEVATAKALNPTDFGC